MCSHVQIQPRKVSYQAKLFIHIEFEYMCRRKRILQAAISVIQVSSFVRVQLVCRVGMFIKMSE